MKRAKRSTTWFWPVALGIGALALIATFLFKPEIGFKDLSWEDHRSYALAEFTVTNRSDEPVELALRLVAERSLDNREGVTLSEIGSMDLDLLTPVNYEKQVKERISFHSVSKGHLTISITYRS